MARQRSLLIALIAIASLGAARAQDKTEGLPKDNGPNVGAPKAKTRSAESAVKPPTPGGTSAVVLDLAAIESVIGKSVKSYLREDMGEIVDVLVTPAGQVRAAVIDFGGVLGVGSRKVAVDWKALKFSGDSKQPVILALGRNQVRVSPEYKPGNPVVILEATSPEEPKVAAPPGAPTPATAAKATTPARK